MTEIRVSESETLSWLGTPSLGESPVWDEAARTLWLVDVPSGHVIAAKPSARSSSRRELGGRIASLVLRADGMPAIAAGATLCTLDRDGRIDTLFEQPHGRVFNDGKCDRLGRWWVGTVSDPPEARHGHFYRVDGDGTAEAVMNGIGVSNGIDWSGDGRRMYYVDNVEQRVDVLDFDAQEGTVANRRPFAEIPRSLGLPDGLTVDADDRVWLAVWGSGRVLGFRPDGTLAQTLLLPAPHVTSCCFGGRGPRTLYVTSAASSADGTPPDQRAGHVFALNVGATGRPARRFDAASVHANG